MLDRDGRGRARLVRFDPAHPLLSVLGDRPTNRDAADAWDRRAGELAQAQATGRGERPLTELLAGLGEFALLVEPDEPSPPRALGGMELDL